MTAQPNEFPYARRFDADQRQHRHVQVIRCGQCGTEDEITSTGKRLLPVEPIAKRMRARGWTIGPRRKNDLCPMCSSKKESNVVNMPFQPKAEPPKTPQREQKRLIVLAIEEAYLGDNKGYAAGVSDETIATSLNVPLAWVREIREEFFGSIGASEEIVKEINETRRGLVALKEAILLDRERQDKERKVVDGRLERLEAMIRATEKKVGL